MATSYSLCDGRPSGLVVSSPPSMADNHLCSLVVSSPAVKSVPPRKIYVSSPFRPKAKDCPGCRGKPGYMCDHDSDSDSDEGTP